jgi:tetratricopeptide (TPR) repeat protein
MSIHGTPECGATRGLRLVRGRKRAKNGTAPVGVSPGRGFCGGVHLAGVGLAGVLLAGVLEGCGPSAETPRPGPAPLPAGLDEVYRTGHRYYLEQQTDSAVVWLRRAEAMDSTFADPVGDLAQLYHEQGLRAGEKSRERQDHFRSARRAFARLEALGRHESEVYERLCELSMALGDDHGFLRYAKINAGLYPYDRQHFNLTRAYFDVEDFQSVIKTAKEGLEKSGDAPYVTSYYRILGRAYMKIGRDQTAEKTLSAGVKTADARLTGLKKSGPDYKSTDGYRRVHDDKLNMLLLLKQLHTTYRADEKLKQVDRMLKEEEYDK